MLEVEAGDGGDDGEGWVVNDDGAWGVLVEAGVVALGIEGANDGRCGGDVSFVLEPTEEGGVYVLGGVALVGGVAWLELVDECFVVGEYLLSCFTFGL